VEAITTTEMRVYDLNAIALGVSDVQLMENAGRAVADAVESRVKGLRGREVAILAGAGGNAGDGITAARHLASRGASVTLYLLSRPDSIRSEAARAQYVPVEAMDLSVKVRVVSDPSDLPRELGADVVIDALLGIGVKGRVRHLYAEAIELINRSGGVKVAVDTPSGLNPDSGEELGPVVKADVTVTFHKPKAGLLRRPEYVGELVVADIGIPPEAELYVGPGDVVFRLRGRPVTAHKGQAGRVLVIGGSETFTGAPALAGLAALRTGSDLAYVAAPERAADVVATYSPNLITVKLRGSDHLTPKHVEELRPWIERADSVVIGPGLGLMGESREAFAAILRELKGLGRKVVIDADGLKHLATEKELVWGGVVLTPHSGEFKKLFGAEPPSIKDLRGRGRAVEEAARSVGATILLKGPVDIISNGLRTRYNKTGAPGMATGGTGDVLSGVTASLLARGLDPFNAACLAAFINGLAGAIAYSEKGDGLTASDLLNSIPRVIKNPVEEFRKHLIYRRVA